MADVASTDAAVKCTPPTDPFTVPEPSNDELLHPTMLAATHKAIRQRCGPVALGESSWASPSPKVLLSRRQIGQAVE
jgi:hypothetical protein